MSFKKSDYYTLVKQACDSVPGFQPAWQKFVEHAAINQKSKSLLTSFDLYSGCQRLALVKNIFPTSQFTSKTKPLTTAFSIEFP